MARTLSTILVLGLLTQGLQAQDTAATKASSWHFLAEPYLMFPNMQGTIGLGELPDLPLDADPDDIFGKLTTGFMLYLEAGNDQWAFSTDFIYMGLEQDAEPSEVINSGSAEFSQLAVEVAGLRRVLPWLEVGLGGRVNSLSADVYLLRNTATGGVAEVASGEGDAVWFDPVLITRASTTAGNWQLQFRGDVGGFGVGSDLTYQLQGYVGYRFSPLFQLTTGYRLIYMDYEEGSGSTSFRYDMSTFGPVMKLGFTI